ncbi:MAG: tetratricopeptide repeat protein [Ignavibacteria bacterium]
MEKTRLETLKEMLGSNPDDTFTRYAVGLEYVSNEMYDEAAGIFEELIAADPNYHPSYYRLGKVYELLGDIERAKKIYEKGIYVTTQQSEMHAREELQAALNELL